MQERAASPGTAQKPVATIRREREPTARETAAVRETLAVRALALGERIDLRALGRERITADSVLIRLDSGIALVFRYGSVVFFGVPAAAEERVLAELGPLVIDPFPRAESEAAELAFGASPREAGDTELAIPNTNTDTLQIVADVFAKSVTLAHYETAVATAFDEIEPLAIDLEESGRSDRRAARVVRHIARALLTQSRLVGRVEVTEKPELLWERPDLELLHLKLAEEYELKERETALERKLALVSRTAEVLLNLQENKRSLRVEWYIVALIVFEILLTLYELFLKHA